MMGALQGTVVEMMDMEFLERIHVGRHSYQVSVYLLREVILVFLLEESLKANRNELHSMI